MRERLLDGLVFIVGLIIVIASVPFVIGYSVLMMLGVCFLVGLYSLCLSLLSSIVQWSKAGYSKLKEVLHGTK